MMRDVMKHLIEAMVSSVISKEDKCAECEGLLLKVIQIYASSLANTLLSGFSRSQTSTHEVVEERKRVARQQKTNDSRAKKLSQLTQSTSNLTQNLEISRSTLSLSQQLDESLNLDSSNDSLDSLSHQSPSKRPRGRPVKAAPVALQSRSLSTSAANKQKKNIFSRR